VKVRPRCEAVLSTSGPSIGSMTPPALMVSIPYLLQISEAFATVS